MTLVALTARRTSAVAALALFAALVGRELVQQPLHIRFIAAACVGLLALVGAMQWPRATFVAALALLPYLALSRRLLLEFAPWKSSDPLLLVVPAVLMIGLIRLYVIERRSFGGDRVTKLMILLIALTVLQVFNPRGGGIPAGVAALLFTAVPLLWFFAGQELATRNVLRTLFGCLVVSASVIAVYGLYGTWYGMPSWDRMWLAQSGYAALVVGHTTRAIGTFSSAAEYASFTAIAIVAAIAFALDRRLYLLPAIPLLAVALFYESSRGVIVTTVVATLVVLAARTGSMRRATVTLVVLLSGVVLALVLARGALETAASSSSNGLVSHQLGGLTHPLSKKNSTLPLHLNMLGNGFRKGLFDPVGYGIGSTTLAGDRFGSAQSGQTEIDLSNQFVALGTFGGFAYLCIFVLVLRAALRQAVARGDAVSLTILGMLVCLAGQWLNGGYYAVAPLIWFSIGFLVTAERRRTAVAEVPYGAHHRAAPSELTPGDAATEVLILTPDFPPKFGGIQTLVFRIADGLRRFQPRVVTLSDPDAPAFDHRQAFAIVRVPARESRHIAIAALNARGAVEGIRRRPAVILSAHIVVGPAAVAVGRLVGRPVVQYVHASELGGRRKLARNVLGRADAVIAGGRYSRSLVEQLIGSSARVHIVRPGVDLPAVRPTPAMQNPSIVVVARLAEAYKGHDVLIRSLALVRAGVPDASLHVVGDGPLRPELERLAAELGVATAVTFHGSASDAERDALLREACVFAMPSRIDGFAAGEGFGIAYIEAGAHGLPVVAGNVGGALDAVVAGVTGLLVDPESPEQVANALSELLLDRARARCMGQAGWEHARSLSWTRTASEVEAVLDEMVSG